MLSIGRKERHVSVIQLANLGYVVDSCDAVKTA